jgi:hypothetical protein
MREFRDRRWGFRFLKLEIYPFAKESDLTGEGLLPWLPFAYGSYIRSWEQTEIDWSEIIQWMSSIESNLYSERS